MNTEINTYLSTNRTTVHKTICALNVTSHSSQPIAFNVEQDGKGEQYVSYKPPKFGMYNVAINFGGMPLPNSPYKVKISPKVDASKVKVAGLGKSEYQCLIGFLKF